jgi:hypothetical protein
MTPSKASNKVKGKTIQKTFMEISKQGMISTSFILGSMTPKSFGKAPRSIKITHSKIQTSTKQELSKVLNDRTNINKQISTEIHRMKNNSEVDIRKRRKRAGKMSLGNGKATLLPIHKILTDLTLNQCSISLSLDAR